MQIMPIYANLCILGMLMCELFSFSIHTETFFILLFLLVTCYEQTPISLMPPIQFLEQCNGGHIEGAKQYNEFPLRNKSYFYICKYLLLFSSSNMVTMNTLYTVVMTRQS